MSFKDRLVSETAATRFQNEAAGYKLTVIACKLDQLEQETEAGLDAKRLLPSRSVRNDGCSNKVISEKGELVL